MAGDTCLVCGLDEAGRGPMAGPVCAAAVILPADFDFSLLNDSKKLTETKRERAMREIMLHASAWCIGWASSAEIDRINILRASLLAMKRSFDGLFDRPAGRSDLRDNLDSLEVIVDGLFVPDIAHENCRALPKADSSVPAVMAASILAKTARDRMMKRYSWLYPQYGYERHKGYATREHIEALKKNGPSPIQRKSFRLKGEGQGELF
ncbi:MAG TPA: ribonuclease HII [Treponemataceae bacterium]|nr:ribonuclease HII [Treponemataceae bacterium]HOS34808.1 ribonuclease HII [Treponemataceae bacterium]HPL91249.1 ribonuclease HII [Treponemataceae bacterium]